MREMLQIMPLVEERQNMDLHHLQTQGEGQAVSNHIADANKMVSDTPRTDAAEKHAYQFKDEYTPVCESKFVRQLERKLNAANAEIEEKRKDVVWLATEKAKLENYVMLLEEAGDTMANAYRQICYDAYDDQQVDNWFKAKEAKP